MRELLWYDQDFNYEHLYVFFDFKTHYGFEIACNMLIDDGNEVKDVRQVLLSPKLTSIFASHVKHVTGPMVTYVVVTSDELTKDEYEMIVKQKNEKKLHSEKDEEGQQ